VNFTFGQDADALVSFLGARPGLAARIAENGRLRRGNFVILPPILVYMENPYMKNK
jgi:hypothetical protein